MRVLLTTLALAIALAASGTVSAQPVGSPAILLSTQNYNLWIYDVQYRRAGADSWLVRIYEPQGTGPFPLLLDVHAKSSTELTRDRTTSKPHRPAGSGATAPCRTSTRVVGTRALLGGDDLGHARHAVHDDALDTGLQRHHRHRASAACAALF